MVNCRLHKEPINRRSILIQKLDDNYRQYTVARQVSELHTKHISMVGKGEKKKIINLMVDRSII